MRLPNSEHAVIDVEKLKNYCLNPSHPEGRHKAKVFRSSLGVGQEDADWLSEAIMVAIQGVEVASAESTLYGWRYDVDILLSRGEKSAILRTGWIVRNTEDFPRLVTCYVR